MGRRSGFIFAFFIMVWMFTACGERNTGYVLINPDRTSNLSDKEREQQYPQYLEGNVRESLTKSFPEGTELTITGGMTESEAFEQFLNNELPVFSGLDREWSIYYEDYCSGGFLDEEEYEISCLDLDNDGKEELVIDSVGHYGAMVIDFREGILYILAEGEGTAGICSYTFIEDEAWIVHSDTSHGGRQMFWFEKLNGDGEVVDQFTLSAEYWEEPEGRYTENSEFTYREEKITMEEYEELRRLYMGW